jgi:hypothetical protein
MGVWAATLNKSEKGFEDAGDVERIARRTKAVKRNRRRRDMENPRCSAPGTKLSRDLGHNAAQLRQCGGFILVRKVPQPILQASESIHEPPALTRRFIGPKSVLGLFRKSISSPLVRSSSNSGHHAAKQPCPKSAKSGHAKPRPRDPQCVYLSFPRGGTQDLRLYF